MYQDWTHETAPNPFRQPPDETKIWRYMSFAKFVSLLEGRALWFSRADLLGDTFEGSYPKGNLAQEIDPELADRLLSDPARNLEEMDPQRRATYRMMNNQFATKTMYSSCWNMSAYESTGLWQAYVKDAEGVAIQTTLGRLKKCFLQAKLPLFQNKVPLINIGMVRYIDYDTEAISEVSMYDLVLHKRAQFAYEQEIRAMIHCLAFSEMGLQQGGNAWADFQPAGISIRVTLHGLIEHIVVRPGSGGWFKELVTHLATKHSFAPGRVLGSKLDEKPHR